MIGRHLQGVSLDCETRHFDTIFLAVSSFAIKLEHLPCGGVVGVPAFLL